MDPKFPCFYPVFSMPPNVFHYNSAQILAKQDGVSSVTIIFPKVNYTYINQDQCVELFKLYLQASDNVYNIDAEASTETNPFIGVKKKFSTDPQFPAYIGLDEKIARSKEFNQAFSENPNIEILLVPSNFEKTSQKMLEAIETGNKVEFFRWLPEHLTKDIKNECWKIVHQDIQEAIITPFYWDKLILENLAPCDIFDVETTGMPNYDAMIKNPGYYYFFKNQHIELQNMSPAEYFKMCADDVHDVSFKSELDAVNKTDVYFIMDKLKKGVKLDTPVLNLVDKSQEGRHRSVVASLKGCDTIPVYVISPVDETKHKEAKEAVIDTKNYDEAKEILHQMNIPLDRMTYNKILWKEFKNVTN